MLSDWLKTQKKPTRTNQIRAVLTAKIQENGHGFQQTIIKHVDRRLVRRDEQTGHFLYSADYSTTYYHLDFAHIKKKKPFFNGQVFIAFDKLRSFDYHQCDIIENCNLHVTVI